MSDGAKRRPKIGDLIAYFVVGVLGLALLGIGAAFLMPLVLEDSTPYVKAKKRPPRFVMPAGAPEIEVPAGEIVHWPFRSFGAKSVAVLLQDLEGPPVQIQVMAPEEFEKLKGPGFLIEYMALRGYWEATDGNGRRYVLEGGLPAGTWYVVFRGGDAPSRVRAGVQMR